MAKVRANIRSRIDDCYEKTRKLNDEFAELFRIVYEKGLKPVGSDAFDSDRLLEINFELVEPMITWMEKVNQQFDAASKANSLLNDLYHYSYPVIGSMDVIGKMQINRSFGYLVWVTLYSLSWCEKFADAHQVSEGLRIPRCLFSLSEDPGKPPIHVQVFKVVNSRLYLEQGQLYRDHVGPDLMVSDATPSSTESREQQRDSWLKRTIIVPINGKMTTDDQLALLYKNTPESQGWNSATLAAMYDVDESTIRKCVAWKVNKQLGSEARSQLPKKRET